MILLGLNIVFYALLEGLAPSNTQFQRPIHPPSTDDKPTGVRDLAL